MPFRDIFLFGLLVEFVQNGGVVARFVFIKGIEIDFDISRGGLLGGLLTRFLNCYITQIDIGNAFQVQSFQAIIFLAFEQVILAFETLEQFGEHLTVFGTFAFVGCRIVFRRDTVQKVFIITFLGVLVSFFFMHIFSIHGYDPL